MFNFHHYAARSICTTLIIIIASSTPAQAQCGSGTFLSDRPNTFAPIARWAHLLLAARRPPARFAAPQNTQYTPDPLAAAHVLQGHFQRILAKPHAPPAPGAHMAQRVTQPIVWHAHKPNTAPISARFLATCAAGVPPVNSPAGFP